MMILFSSDPMLPMDSRVATAPGDFESPNMCIGLSPDIIQMNFCNIGFQ